MAKKFKTSQEVYEHFEKKEIQDGVIEFKGGYAVVKDKVVKEIFVGAKSKKNAEKRLKQLT